MFNKISFSNITFAKFACLKIIFDLKKGHLHAKPEVWMTRERCHYAV